MASGVQHPLHISFSVLLTVCFLVAWFPVIHVFRRFYGPGATRDNDRRRCGWYAPKVWATAGLCGLLAYIALRWTGRLAQHWRLLTPLGTRVACKWLLVVRNTAFFVGKAGMYGFYVLRARNAVKHSPVRYSRRFISTLLACNVAVNTLLLLAYIIPSWLITYGNHSSHGGKDSRVHGVGIATMDLVFGVGTVWLLLRKLFQVARRHVRGRTGSTAGSVAMSSPSHRTSPQHACRHQRPEYSVSRSRNPHRNRERTVSAPPLPSVAAIEADLEASVNFGRSGSLSSQQRDGLAGVAVGNTLSLSTIKVPPKLGQVELKSVSADSGSPTPAVEPGTPPGGLGQLALHSIAENHSLRMSEIQHAGSDSFANFPKRTESSPAASSASWQVNPVVEFHNNTCQNNPMFFLAIKLNTLVFWTSVTSVLTYFSWLYLSGGAYLIDATVNIYCLWLSFSFTENFYTRICCQQRCELVLFPCIKMCALSCPVCRAQDVANPHNDASHRVCGCHHCGCRSSGCRCDAPVRKQQVQIFQLCQAEYRLFSEMQHRENGRKRPMRDVSVDKYSKYFHP